MLVPHTADGRIARKGGSGSEHLVSCLELADLVQREVHIGTELFFFCSLAFMYIILPLILLGEEIPLKNVAYSYQAMS